ncbi:hypothetical protein O181_060395 [Austropuccinia psidii MF-1]|uniref:Uncharacterized protein n=1 Tax=Austropuccinia psidii MF-1 TaxID=1389203 RepID=A0A9Q3EDA0_9BASI|nr:hypothetical protein [Austropuccinia psidii MF-1]
MTDWSNKDNNQVLIQEVPQLKELATCTGEVQYDHMSFIKTIDMLEDDYDITDELITARLHLLFDKSAKRWYYGIRQTNDKDKPLTWFLKQVGRLNALYLEISQRMVDMKILKKCACKLEHALRSRCIEPCSTEEYINALKDIVTRTKIGRAWKKLDIKNLNKPFIKKDKPREPFKPNTPNINEKRKCCKLGGIGHLADNCLEKAKINEIVETEGHNDKEEESDSEKDTE